MSTNASPADDVIVPCRTTRAASLQKRGHAELAQKPGASSAALRSCVCSCVRNCVVAHHVAARGAAERYARFFEETLLIAIDEPKVPRAFLVRADRRTVRLGYLLRRGSDSNRRVTVLQRAEAPSEIAAFDGPTFPPGNERGIGAWALALAAERAIFRHARIVNGTVRDRKVREDAQS
jgi:hypothetical protein